MPEAKRSCPKEIAGNKTKLNHGETPISQYATSTVTNYEKDGQNPPKISQDDVDYAKNFVQENKK